jgi:hypothetical protein
MLRPTTVRIDVPVRCSELPEHLKKLTAPISSRKKFIPYWDPESYLRDLGNSGCDTTELKRLHIEHPPIGELDFVKKPPLHINTKPIEKLYNNRKTKPSLEERVKALHEAGYPDEILIDVMKKDAKRNTESLRLDEFVFAIFGDVNDKKTPSTKKKTIHQLLKIKKRVYAMPEPSDEENPVEDDLCEGEEDDV